MVRGTNSFFHKATKTAERGHDAKKLDPIQEFMLKENIPTVRERTIINDIFTTRNKVHVPDLTVTTDKILLEHDTVKVHGELGFENNRTQNRNSDYTKAGLDFFVINADLARHLNLSESSLAVYLYYHEKMKRNSRQ